MDEGAGGVTRLRLRHAVSLRVEPAAGDRPFLALDNMEPGSGRIGPDLGPTGSADGIRLEPGDLVFSKLRPYLAKSARIEEPLDGTGELLTMIPGPLIDGQYLLYCTLSTPWLDHSVLTSYGTKMPRTSWDQMAEFRLPAIDVAAQRKIADFLDDQVARIDNIIAARQQQISLASVLEGAELTAIVFGSAMRSIPLGYIALVDHGRQRSPDNDHGPYMTPYVRSANVGDGRIDSECLLEMNFTPSERGMYGLRSGDVLVTEASGSVDAIGASAQWNDATRGVVCFQNHLLRVRPRGNLADPDFLHWWARASYRSGAMRIWATGANILNLGSEALKRMPSPQIGLAQQRVVANQAAEMSAWHEAVAEALQQQVVRFTELKRSLITAAVSGEFDVSSADGSQVPVETAGGVPAGTPPARAGVAS